MATHRRASSRATAKSSTGASGSTLRRPLIVERRKRLKGAIELCGR
jgi:hypothetical protein